MALNIPASDVDLLGVSVQMIVPASLPAALSDLLLEAAGEIHGGRGPFAKHGEFPNPNMVSLPLSRAAERYFERGPSPLWRVLPFRLATLVDRFLWVAASVASAAFALFGLLPKLLGFRYQRASLALYRRLESVEKALGANTDRTAMLAELTRLNTPVRRWVYPKRRERNILVFGKTFTTCVPGSLSKAKKKTSLQPRVNLWVSPAQSRPEHRRSRRRT
ncbi:MAG: hypothetical protein IPO43_19550 [Rhodoferax sp.]|nr:hypothetical protein [Rhodoferax sp.]